MQRWGDLSKIIISMHSSAIYSCFKIVDQSFWKRSIQFFLLIHSQRDDLYGQSLLSGGFTFSMGGSFFGKIKRWGGYPLVFLALSLIPAWHVVGGKGDGIAIVWFFGVVVYFMLSRNLGQSIPVKYCFLFFGSLVSLGLVKAFVSPNFVKFYDKAAIALLVFALFFLFTGLQKLKGTVSPEIHSIVNFFADYSYTLYLIHFTVIWSILALDMTAKYNVSKVETLLLAYLLSNLLAIAMAYLGEKKHLKIRKKLKSWLMDRNTENSKFRTVR